MRYRKLQTDPVVLLHALTGRVVNNLRKNYTDIRPVLTARVPLLKIRHRERYSSLNCNVDGSV